MRILYTQNRYATIVAQYKQQKGKKMYHIIEDKRAHKSATLICEGLSEMLQRKPYEEIRITDVCSPKGVARTTFYRLFDTLDDVLLYQFDTLFEESLKQYTTSPTTEKSYAKILLQIAMSNKSLLTAIIHSGRNDLFEFSTRTKENALLQSINLNINEQDKLYCRTLINYIAYAILSTWVNQGCKESPNELYQIMKNEISIIHELI